MYQEAWAIISQNSILYLIFRFQFVLTFWSTFVNSGKKKIKQNTVYFSVKLIEKDTSKKNWISLKIVIMTVLTVFRKFRVGKTKVFFVNHFCYLYTKYPAGEKTENVFFFGESSWTIFYNSMIKYSSRYSCEIYKFIL